MKKILISTLALALLVSCEETALVPENNCSTGEFFASTEAFNATKTTLDGNNNVVWSEGDQVVAFTKTNRASTYQIQEKYVGKATGAFSLITGPDGSSSFEPGQDLAHNIMLYPYSSDVRCKIDDNETLSYKLNVTLPEVQSYTENSFSNGAFPMLAVSESNTLAFKNICGGVKIQLTGEDKIQSIKLEGLGNEKLAGQATVVGYANGSNPTITMSSSATTSVTLDCGEGVQLDEANPTTFIIALPPVTFASGIKLTVTDSEGLSRTLTNSSKNTILRSSLLTFPAITYKQEGVFELPEGSVESFEIPTEGGNVEIPIITNQDYEVNIPEAASDWITIVETKAVREETIVLHVEANTTPEDRSAEVVIATTEGEILQSITIAQEGVENVQPNNEIWYTSSNGQVITPYSSSAFDATIVSNTYADGKGVIVFDEDITQIGQQAFYNCSQLISITLPKSITTIGQQAFDTCYNMTDLNIQDNVSRIGDNAFYFCLNLKNITLPANLTSLGYRAFGDCSSLTEISIPSGITALANNVFQKCTKLTSITLPESLKSIGEFTFNGCTGLTCITIPDGVTSIGELAFAGCTNLQEFNNVHASADKRSIIFNAVLNCFAPGGITEYIIPEGVTNIGRYAFYGCSNLTSITLSKDVTTVEYAAFWYCTGELIIDCNDVKCDSSNSFTKLTINEGVTSITKSAFSSFTKLTSTIIPSSVTTIGENAFANCTGEAVINCNLPTQAFYNSAFTKVTIGNNVKNIGKEAFLNCSKLKEIVIPESVTSIGVMAFSACRELESITIPSSVTTIGYSAFLSCDKLSTIYCNPSTPPSTTNNLNINSSTKIYVPAGSGEAYKKAPYWSAYASMIEEITNSINYIDEYGVNHGPGIEIDGIVWAPVNCGYHETNYPFGKFYQWGRKYGQSHDDTKVEMVQGPVSSEEGQMESNANKHFYLTNSQTYHWDTDNSYNLWPSEENDPCPDGWRVPSNSDLTTLSKNFSAPSIHNGQKGFWLSGTTTYSDTAPQIFLPAAGYRQGHSSPTYQFQNEVGIYWSCSGSEDNNGAKVLDIRYNGDKNEQVMIDRYAPCSAYSVRCIQGEYASSTDLIPENGNM